MYFKHRLSPKHVLFAPLTLVGLGLALVACDPPADDPPSGASATSGTSGSPMDESSTGGEETLTGDASETDADGSTSGDPEGTTTGTGTDTSDTGNGDGMFACSTGRLFLGNPTGDPTAWPADGAALIDMTADGPALPARKIVVSPDDPTKMIATTGSELWAIDTAAGTLSHILGSREDALFRAGPCDEARIGIVSDIVITPEGTLYAGDHSGNAVVKIEDPLGAGCQMSYFAGTSEETSIDSNPHEPDFVDGPGAQARFSGPDYLGLGSDGSVFVIDTGNSAVRKIDAAGEVSTLVELPSDYSAFGGTSANSIAEIGGMLYVATRGSVQSSQNATILQLDPATGDLTEVVTGRDEPWLVGSSSPAIAGAVPVEGSMLLTWVNGRLFTVDVDTAEVVHVAGDGDMPWQSSDIPGDYDPFAEHDAFDLMLDNLSASTAGKSTYMTYHDGALYYSAQARGFYVEAIDCE